MSIRDTPPPVQPGPFIDPWPGVPGGLQPISRTRFAAPLGAGGGSIVVPPDSAPVFSMQRYAFANGTKVFSVAQANTDIITEPPGSSYRAYLYVRNSSATAVIYLEFGGLASATSAIRLAVNEQIAWDAVVPQDNLTAFADAAGGQISLLFANLSLPP